MTKSFSNDDALNRDILVFSKRLLVLLKSGSPIVPALTVLSKDDRIHSALLKSAIASVAEDIQNTLSLADLLAEYDNLFPPFYIAMIRLGEKTGSVDAALSDILSVYEFEHQLDAR